MIINKSAEDPRYQDSHRTEPDYFSFPLTDAEALEQVTLNDKARVARAKEKEWRAKASAALKAANALKKEAAWLDKRARKISQKNYPAAYGTDLLSDAEKKAFEAYKASGKRVTKEEARTGPFIHYFCEKCAENAPMIRAKVRLEHPYEYPFRGCLLCGRYSGLVIAASVILPIVERRAA